MSTMNGYYDITDYYMAGDLDYTAAVTRAEQACESAGGGVVYFPPGMWALSGMQTGYPLPIPIAKNGVQWRGAGAGVALIVGAVSNANQLTFVEVQSSVSLITIADIGFVGNGYAVAGSIAASMIVFDGGSHHKVLNCYFTSPTAKPNTTGPCIQFFGVTDGEVAGCRFYNYGFVDNTTPNKADHTDAVFVNPTSIAVRVHDNHVENGGLGGIRNELGGAGGWCDLSHNFVTNVWGGAVILHHYDTRTALNDASHTRTIGVGHPDAGSQNIDVGKPRVFALIGNLASDGEGDGIASNGCSSGTLVGNLCWDNVMQSNDCGLQLIGQKSGSNLGMQMIGNMCFDDGPGTQEIGIHLFTNDDSFSRFSTVIGNATYFTATTTTAADTTQGIAESIYNDKILTREDSNAILANNDWPERLHQVAKAPVSPASLFKLRDVIIPSRYMLTQCGIRITAGGVITGSAGTKTFDLGFGGSRNNIFSVTVPRDIGTWSFVAVITNNADNSIGQAATATFCGGTAVLGVFTGTLVVDTALQNHVVELWVRVANAGDSIRSDYFNIERC